MLSGGDTSQGSVQTRAANDDDDSGVGAPQVRARALRYRIGEGSTSGDISRLMTYRSIHPMRCPMVGDLAETGFAWHG